MADSVDSISENPESIDLATLVRQHRHFEGATADQRTESQRAWDYVDGIQWTKEEIEVHNREGRPLITVNRIAPKVHFIWGTELRGRTDPKALPRNQNQDEDSAEAITDALRYVDDLCNIPAVKSEATADVLVPGYAAAIVGVEPYFIKQNGERIERRRFTVCSILWREFSYDPYSRLRDFSDAKWLAVNKWHDIDDARANPQYKGATEYLDSSALASAFTDAHEDAPSNWWDESRQRVLIREVYYWRINPQTNCKEWWMCHHTSSGFLINPRLVPFVDEDGNSWCPIIPVSAWTFRGSADTANRRYGIVRDLMPLQDEINKRRSLALHLLMSHRVLHEEGTIADIQEFQNQLQRPDGAPKVDAPGAIKDGSVQVLPNSDLAAGQAQLLSEAKAEIDNVGPSLANIAGDKRTLSGVAIARQQNIGSVELEPILDNIRDWQIRLYNSLWLLIRQYWDYETWLRVQDSEEKTGYRFVGLNRRMTRAQRFKELLDKGVPLEGALSSLGMEKFEATALAAQAQQLAQQEVVTKIAMAGAKPEQLPPEAQQKAQALAKERSIDLLLRFPQMQEEFRGNDVTRMLMDIKIDTTPDVSILQDEQFALLSEMLRNGIFNPAITPAPVASMLVDLSQLRDKKKLVAKLEQMQQQNPEQAQAQQAQMAMQMQQMQLQLQKLAADIENTKADTALTLEKAKTEQPKAAGEMAYAVHTAVNAGRNSVPSMPAMAAGSKGNMK